jgi:hypothetical protein
MAESKILRKIGVQLNRRSLLRGVGAGVFGSAMAISVGKAPAAFAASCTGPGGTGACYSSNCNGSHCRNSAYIQCSTVSGYCGGGSCWTSGGGTCCDCRCTDSNRLFYCYCYG